MKFGVGEFDPVLLLMTVEVLLLMVLLPPMFKDEKTCRFYNVVSCVKSLFEIRWLWRSNALLYFFRDYAKHLDSYC